MTREEQHKTTGKKNRKAREEAVISGINLLIHSCNKYLLSTFYIPDVNDTVPNKPKNGPILKEFTVQLGKTEHM